MRIAVVHSFYSSAQPSGENIVVNEQVAQLEAAGHEVFLISRNSDVTSIWGKLLQIISASWSAASGFGPSPAKQLKKFKPQIVHVHNTFPNWGIRWTSKAKVPIVLTLHNFRYVCASGTMLLNGTYCNLCVKKKTAISAVINRCYRNSIFASIPLAVGISSGASSILMSNASCVIVLSERAKKLHVQNGIDERKIKVVPNFVQPFSSNLTKETITPKANWIFIGRLSPEKGLVELLRHWPEDQILDVYGAGELLPQLSKAMNTNINFKGVKPREYLFDILPSYKGLIFPSLAAEGAIPMTYVEALAAGVPTICLKGNGAADDVQTYSTGVAIDSWVDLSKAMEEIENKELFYLQNCIERYSSGFLAKNWTDRMIEIYGDLICN